MEEKSLMEGEHIQKDPQLSDLATSDHYYENERDPSAAIQQSQKDPQHCKPAASGINLQSGYRFVNVNENRQETPSETAEKTGKQNSGRSQSLKVDDRYKRKKYIYSSEDDSPDTDCSDMQEDVQKSRNRKRNLAEKERTAATSDVNFDKNRQQRPSETIENTGKQDAVESPSCKVDRKMYIYSSEDESSVTDSSDLQEDVQESRERIRKSGEWKLAVATAGIEDNTRVAPSETIEQTGGQDVGESPSFKVDAKMFIYSSEDESPVTDYSDPQEDVQKSRGRKRNPEEWKRTVAKKLRNSGKEYLSLKSGKLRPGRKILTPCGKSCRLKCTTRFSEHERQHYFDSFWKFGDVEKQRCFINEHIKTIQPQYRKVVLDRKRNRGLNKAYFFTKGDDVKFVCRQFFTSTLGISDRYIRTAVSKNADGFLKEDQRGKKSHPVVPEEIKKGMREHLATIPAVESHCAGADTQTKCPGGAKPVTDLYNDYVEECNKAGMNYGKLSLYRHLFNYEFNVSRKDQCLQCDSRKNSENVGKRELEQVHIE